MKKALSILLFAAMIVAMLAFPTSAAWDGTASASLKGDGTQDSPYLVETAEDLAFLAKSVNEGNTYEGKYIVQTADIDLGGKEWTPIGHQKINSAETDAPFSGVYSGLGHKVTGLSITTVGDSHVGLFGYVMSGEIEAGIADLTVEGAITLDGVTASNFGRIRSTATKNDLALGLINMILQTAGVIAAITAKSRGFKKVIVTGSLTALPQAQETFDGVTALHGIPFLIPENATFATALGAAALQK